jgi:hypothetical protein
MYVMVLIVLILAFGRLILIYYYYYYYYYEYYKMNSNKLECIQIKFAALCHNRLLQDVVSHYDHILEKLNLQVLHIRRLQIDVFFFLINDFTCTK